MTIKYNPTSLTVLDPRTEAVELPFSVAPGLDNLDGKVLGLLDNGKANAANLVRLIGDMLMEKFEIKAVKSASKTDASRPATRETLDELARECDFAVVAIGD